MAGGACAIQRTKGGNQVLVGYVVPAAPLTSDSGTFDHDLALIRLREQLPAALVPLLAVVDDLPTRTSGKIDRAALPWPLPTAHPHGPGAEQVDTLTPTESWLAEHWYEILGVEVETPSPTSSTTAAAA